MFYTYANLYQINNLQYNLKYMVWLVYGVWRHFQQYFFCIMAISFIGGGNVSTRRKPPTCHKSLTNIIT